jgi:protein SCO1
MKLSIPIAILALATSAFAAEQHAATGMVLKIDAPHKSFVVSCQAIPGFMEAMTMPFDVRDAKELEGLAPGNMVDFTLVVDGGDSYVEHVHVRPYESVEQDPMTARRLKLLNRLSNPATAPKQLAIGERVPDFTLIDQRRQRVALSQYAGKVVAINFIYTSCALPNFCYRISNNFGVLQQRFKEQMGRDLVLLTVTFDPQRDQPETLAHYAQNWKADPATWHFLTGPVPDVQRVTNLFGMDYFPDEGLMNHSLHTAVIDRQGKLVANIEGNQFTADQLADLVKTVLSQPADHTPAHPVRMARNASRQAAPAAQ